MAVFNAAYRYRVFLPRSEDSTETTVMTPAAGAPHSDSFQVASVSGVGGYHPYLTGSPLGRRGELNFLKGRTSVGRLNLANVDKRIGTDPQDNLERWFTAFTGHSTGRDRLRGAKVVVEESLDGGSTWTTFYTGRIASWEIRSAIEFHIVLRDLADDLDARIFVGRPAATVTYAQFPMLLPLGLRSAYAGQAGTNLLEAAYVAGSGATRVIDVRPTNRGTSHPGNIVTKALTDGAELSAARDYQNVTAVDNARLRFQGTVTGEFAIDSITIFRAVKHRIAVRFKVRELPTGDPDRITFPVANENATAAVVYRGPPSGDHPLFIDNVHPATLIRDILQGEFDVLDSSGNPIHTFDFDSTEFTNFINDLTWKTLRFRITEEDQLLDWIAKHITMSTGLLIREEPDGSFKPVDLRTPTSLSPPTIAQSDLDEAANPSWTNEGKPVTQIRAKWRSENRIPFETIRDLDDRDPDVPTSRFREKEHILGIIDDEALQDLGDKVLTIDADGYRAFERELNFGTIRHSWNKRELEKRIRAILRVYARGPNIAAITTRRAASVTGANLCLVGDYRIIDVDQLPDPSTNLRGGPRLMLCISRQEDRLRIRFKFLDVGLNVTAGVPTFSSIALTTGDEQHSVDAIVARNSENDAVEIQYALTATSVSTRPAEDSELWTFGGLVFSFSSTTFTIGRLPSDIRVWARARSNPQAGTTTLRQPSAWVFPATPVAGNVDTSALAVPTGLSTTNITNVSALLNWSNGDATLPVEVLFGPDGGPLSVIATLPPGSTQHRVTDLTINTIYDWEVRHVDDWGASGATAAATFTTTNAAGTNAPDTGVPVVLIGANPHGIKQSDIEDAEVPITGVYIEVRPSDATLPVEVEFSQPTANSNITSLITLPPGQTTFVHQLPTNGVTHFYRTRHGTAGLFDNPSGWSGWSADATPGLLPDGILDSTVYTGTGGLGTAVPDKLVAPTGADRWAILE